jgi:cytochrome c-type biogenesis protein CcmH
MGAALALYAKLGTPIPPATPPIPAPMSEPNAPNITQADINAMVEGLAARLAEEPDDSEGWTRLIRSRIVLGDVQALLKDHQAMSQYYAAQPEVLERINTQSGFTELARTLSEEAYTKREAP